MADEPNVEVITPIFYIEYAGRRIDLLGLSVRQDVDAPGWRASVALADAVDFAIVPAGAVVTLHIQTEPFVLRLTEKDLTRQSVKPALNWRLETPACTDLFPKITDTWEVTLASVAANYFAALLGTTITWNIVDWPIKAGALAYENAKPLDILRTLAGAPRGVIQANPDGTLRAQYRYPKPVKEWRNAVPDKIFTDLNDNLSYREGYGIPIVYNAITIGDGQDSAQQFKHQVSQIDPQRAHIEVYATPWIDADGFDLLHTAAGYCRISAPVLRTETQTIFVEIKDGSGELPHPALSVGSWQWHYQDGGTVQWAVDSPTLQAAAGVYGLLEVTFTRRWWRFEIFADQPADTIQFLIIGK
jgi:hypothetical protein